MNFYEINGTYGSNLTPCTVLIAEKNNGSKWYCVEGSLNVNQTFDPLHEGVDIETVQDSDMFTWSSAIEDLDQLETAVNY